MSGRDVHSFRPSTGASLTEFMFVVAIMITLTGIAVPAMLTGLDAARTAAAARYMAGQVRLARVLAVSRSIRIAIRFERDDRGIRYAFYEDGNANGIRTADITRGVDPRTTPVERIGDRFPGVRFGAADGVNAVGGGALGSDPIRFGRSDILTFTPAGTATSGTVYLLGRSGRQYAVRVLGATGRTRILEFNFGMGKWLPK